MKAVTLLYHDAVESAAHLEASGFPGTGAAPYKLDASDMAAHFRALAAAIPFAPERVTEWMTRPPSARGQPLFITFDDGGQSAATVIADLLAAQGWTAHFFVTTDYINTPAFVSEEEVRLLRRAGHVIGSHSATHPQRMAACDHAALVREWTTSRRRLEELLGEPVTVASVPGGYYSRRVAEAASEAGLTALFTSEPVKRVHRVGDTWVFGRYNLWRGMSPAISAQLGAPRSTAAQMRQYLLWNAKKMVKGMGGRYYLECRRLMLDKNRPA